MTEPRRPKQAELSGKRRLLAAVVGLSLILPLGGARLLEPSPQGHGTHRQLGLPPCRFAVVFGRRCPACGMTTSWAHRVRGQGIEALQSSVGGTLLGVLDLVVAAWVLLSAACRRWLRGVPNGTAAAWLVGLVAIATLAEWGVRLVIRS